MKKCKFCGSDIDDTAIKCKYCFSFQDSKIEKKERIDTASLIINYIGVIAVIVSIGLGLFGFLGYKTFNDIKIRTNELLKKSTDETNELKTQLSNLTKEFNNSTILINDLLISQLHNRYQEIIDSFMFDRMEKVKFCMPELLRITNETTKERTLSNSSKLIIKEIQIITEAIKLYQNNNYNEVLDIINKLKDDNIYKHRVLMCSYGKLYEEAIKDNKAEEAKLFMEELLEHSPRYDELAKHMNKKTIIGRANKANILLHRNESGDLEEAIKLLKVIILESPNNPYLYFNIATAYYKSGNIELTLINLKNAKRVGFFQTDDEIQKFKENFKLLVESNDPKIKNEIGNLLNYSQQ